jgi:hypothetical protein
MNTSRDSNFFSLTFGYENACVEKFENHEIHWHFACRV